MASLSSSSCLGCWSASGLLVGATTFVGRWRLILLLCPGSEDCEGGARVGARVGGLILGWFRGRGRLWCSQGAYSPAPGEVGEIFGVTELLPPPDVLEVVRVEDLPGLADVSGFVPYVRVVSAARVLSELHLAKKLLGVSSPA